MHSFSIFSKTFNKPCVNFCAFGRKTLIVGKFWENFEIFWWKFYRKIEFFIYFLFLFFIFFENLLLKIELSEKRQFFYNNFFRFRGGGNFPPFPPGYALGMKCSFYACMLFDCVIFHICTHYPCKSSNWAFVACLRDAVSPSFITSWYIYESASFFIPNLVIS